ncbi:MAG: methionine--tRNA ligase [Deltaproteobacteria bacterium]|nr:methionine--tRNA ligase [Deltaproteobacteria bacterium]
MPFGWQWGADMSGYFYLTTPIYYVNAEAHIGHTYTTVLCDTIVRYRRLCGDTCFFLTGSDEHGEKVLEVARRRGESPAQTAEYFSNSFLRVWEEIGISHDRFIRTTDADHKQVVQQILQRVYDEGEIRFKEYEGLYCVGCERFLTDRDMLDGLCRDHERAPEPRTEANYFFDMGAHFSWLRDYIEQNPDFIRPERYKNEVLAMLDEETGLGGELCISRPKSRLDWGIELPFDTDYVCYVWFDALINYLTGIGYPDGPHFQDYWSNCEHVVGKDILKPHGVFWPTMLRAIGLEPPRHVSVHGYWNVDDRKVSKSLGNMIDPLIMREKYGFEAFRYFLLRDMVFGQDSNFSEDALVRRINADLANNIGNLVSRTLNMTGRFAGGLVPEPGAIEIPEREVIDAAATAVAEVDLRMRGMRPQRALESILALVDATNRYLELREPWKAAKDPELADTVSTTLHTCCESLRIVALLLAAFLPVAAAEILDRLGLGDALETAVLPASAEWGGIPVGSPTRKGKPLFPRIETAGAEDAESKDGAD